MKTKGVYMIVLVVIASFLIGILPSNAAEEVWGTVSKYDIVTTAEKAGTFNTLVAAIKAAGLEDLMRQQNSYTVFAPTDEAFANLPPGTLEELLLPENRDKLQAILTYHVLMEKRIISSRLKGVHELQTVNGKKLKVWYSPDRVLINNALVVKPDITTKNGMIHVIDMVLLP
ncbi:MAG: fasciclin domain-containing protein [Synergistales bacterium]|nr:fasciclin domain-containing protein [Synergistales bacterium]